MTVIGRCDARFCGVSRDDNSMFVDDSKGGLRIKENLEPDPNRRKRIGIHTKIARCQGSMRLEWTLRPYQCNETSCRRYLRTHDKGTPRIHLGLSYPFLSALSL